MGVSRSGTRNFEGRSRPGGSNVAVSGKMEPRFGSGDSPSCTSSTRTSTGGRARCRSGSASARAFPYAHANDRGGYTYLRQDDVDYILNSWTEWFDLDKQLEHMDGLGHQVDVVCSIGPFSVFFSDLPARGRPRGRHPLERGDGGRAEEISGPALGQRRGAAHRHQDRHRSARRRRRPARPDGRQHAGLDRRRSAHRRRAARAVLRARRGARPAAVPASDRRRVRRRAGQATTARCI